MKLLIASDLHGGADACAKVCNIFEKTGADMLVLLGDVLYHGPRNDLPQDTRPTQSFPCSTP